MAVLCYKIDKISSKKDTKMRFVTILMTVFIATAALMATDATAKDEIYRWVDENGVVHFGDRTEGRADVEQIDIRNGNRSSSAPASADTNQQQEPQQPSYAQQRRDERAEIRKKAAEEEKDLAKGCAHHRQLVAQLEPSTRVMVTYEDGKVVRMDDNERLKSLTESKAYIAENCNK